MVKKCTLSLTAPQRFAMERKLQELTKLPADLMEAGHTQAIMFDVTDAWVEGSTAAMHMTESQGETVVQVTTLSNCNCK